MPDPATPAASDLLTITEAAELLRAPVATLRYWRHLGTGPDSFRLGRRVLYRRDDLTALLPLRGLQRLALPGRTYRLALTPGLLAQVFVREGDSFL